MADTAAAGDAAAAMATTADMTVATTAAGEQDLHLHLNSLRPAALSLWLSLRD